MRGPGGTVLRFDLAKGFGGTVEVVKADGVPDVPDRVNPVTNGE